MSAREHPVGELLMGSRDYRKREPKKAKKSIKQISTDVILPPPVTVEVIKKGKKQTEAEEEG